MGRSNTNGLVTGAALAGITVVGATALAVCRRRLKTTVRQDDKGTLSSWLAQAGISRFSLGHAGVFKLDGLDRNPQGKIGGAGVLRCSDTGSNVPVETLGDVPGLVLYSIEILDGQIVLLLMQVPSVAELFRAPFLDRGVLELAQIGSSVYVASLDSVEKLDGFVPVDKLPPCHQALFSIVWNTGRCGSMRMHKMLQKLGVLSFSEPNWLDTLCNLSLEGLHHDMISRVFGVCAAVDVLLVRRYLQAHPPMFGAASTLGSGYVSFKVKRKGYTGMEAVMRALPHAKHLLMYRDVRKVTESFGSVFRQKAPLPLSKNGLLRQILGVLPCGKTPAMECIPALKAGTASPTFSRAVKQAVESGALVKPSNPLVGLLTMDWVETMCLWKEMAYQGLPKGGETSTLLMEDFTRKDRAVIESILLFILGEEVEVGEEAIATALETFQKPKSQAAWDAMDTSSHVREGGKARFLTPSDVEDILAVVTSVPEIGSPDYKFPGSLGAVTSYRKSPVS